MTNWRGRLNRANAAHVNRLAVVLEREFARVLKELDQAKPMPAVRDHALRLTAILGAHKRAAAVSFGFLALEMLRGNNPENSRQELKADAPPPSRAEQVGRVLLELARTIAVGAMAVLIAEALAKDRGTVAAVEAAILAAPDPSPAAIARAVLQSPHVAQRLALAHAMASGAGDGAEAVAAALEARPIQPHGGGAGGGGPPPPGGPGGSDPPPRASRFADLVEQIVREEAPVRARTIARSSGAAISEILARGAREGWGEDRVAKELRQRLGGLAGHRARAIARTEIGSAQNAAILALAQDRAARGERLEKVWVAIDDARTRESHNLADDQVRPLDQPFAVGRALLMHPGDPAAPLGEIINCRCAMLIRRRAD